MTISNPSNLRSKQLLEILRRIYLKAEQNILKSLLYKRSRGLIDYAETAAIERVQRILQNMVDEAWEYIPKLVESQFYVDHPEAARLKESAVKHIAGYSNAKVLTSEQTAIVERLSLNLMGEVMEAAETAQNSVVEVIGRLNQDSFRTIGLSNVAQMEAEGIGSGIAAARTEAELKQNGITAFIDQANRRWSLYTYTNMVTRTTSRQAEILSLLTADSEQDLYMISSHGTTCPICAPLEGRVYSRSGKDSDFPSLAMAFGKVDKNGPDTLENSYLNIHPNCLHVLISWTPMGRNEKEIERIKRFSSFKSNPPTIDPRSEKQIADYRAKEKGRAKYLADCRQYQRYRIAMGDKVPKTFQTFQKHKLAKDDVYKSWEKLYRNRER